MSLPDLDALLTVSETAAWLKLSERKVRSLAKEKRLPAVRMDRRNLRFHPRTILAKFKMEVA